jgi:WD40 repeat protein
MAWPLSQDYNEAIQNPPSSFADPELKAGQAVTNALGVPLPRSGNFADVYEFQGAGGAKWAVKCFTREVPGLRERYSEISKHLVQAKLPFTVDFNYLEQGVRIRGQWYPVLKMQWVEGFLLNEFVRNNLDKPALLDGLGQIWLRMARRLREARTAHADLQHGNVILVPGTRASSLAVKLIDYDGMFVPALAQKKSGEVGHPAYQHPLRLKQGIYNAEVDRLPLLAIACALRCLAVGGRGLWERFDNGDNLLFREADLKAPAESALFRELWNLPDPAVHDLVGYLALGLAGPLEQAPLLPEVAAEDGTRPLPPPQEQKVTAVLGPGAKVKRVAARPKAAIRAGQPQPAAGADWQSLTGDEDAAPIRRRRKKAAASPLVLGIAAACVLAVLGVGGLIFALTRGGGTGKNLASTERGKQTQVAQGKTNRVGGATSTRKGSDNQPPQDTRKERPPDDPGPGNIKPPPEKEQNPPVVVVANPGGPSPLDKLDPARIDPADRHFGFRDDLVAVLKDYPGMVWSLAFSPDGKRLAAGGSDGQTLTVWDLTGEKPAASSVRTEPGGHGVAFSPDGQRVAIGSNRAAEVWDLAADPPRPLFKVAMPQTSFRWLALSNKLLAATGEGEVLLADISGPEPVLLRPLPGHRGRVVMVAISPSGKLLASGGQDGTVRVWDLTTIPPLLKANLATGNPVWSVAFSPDGQDLAAGCAGGMVHVYSLGSPETPERWRKKGHFSPAGFANGVAFAPDGKTLVSTEGSYTENVPFNAVWWNTGDGGARKTWRLPERCATVAFAPDGRYIALGSHNRKVYILRLGEKRAAPAEDTAQAKYLCDMEEFDVVKGPWEFGKGKINVWPIKIRGVESPHGLGMHPPSGSFARVKYRLDGRWKTFKAAVGLNDTEPNQAVAPLIFQVWVDGKLRWQSQPVQKPRVKQDVLTDVSGVEVLELRVLCQGNHDGAHAVWLEPQVTKETEIAKADTRYLSDMGEFDALTDPGFGFSKGKFADKEIIVGGVKSPHGLAMHPPSRGFATVKYNLGGRWKTFTARVGLNYTAPQNAASSLTFEVVGDNKSRGQSKPVQEVGVTQEMRADVSGVETLELRVHCPASNMHAHAVWLEPMVSKEEGPPAVAEAPRPAGGPALTQPARRPGNIAVSPDGRYAAWDGDKKCHVWDRVAGKEQLLIPVSAGVSNGFTFSPDGKQLAVREHMTAAVRVWDVARRKPLFVLPDKGPLNCVTYSADGRYLLTGTGVFFDPGNGKPKQYTACAFNVWNAQTGTLVKHVENKKAPVNYLAAPGDGKSVLACDFIHAADVYDWKAGKLLQSIRTPVPMGGRPNIQWGPDGPRMLFVSAFTPGQFTLHDLLKNQPLLERPSGLDKARLFAWSPDGRFVALVPEQARTEIYVLDLFSDKRVGPLTGHTEEVRHLAVSRDGTTVLSADSSSVRLWTPGEAGKEPTPAAMSPEERLEARFIGTYDMTYKEAGGAGAGRTRWSMTKDHRAAQDGRDRGAWKAKGNRIVLTYDQPGLGSAILQTKGKDTWVGVHRQLNGQVFNWVLKRLGPAD